MVEYLTNKRKDRDRSWLTVPGGPLHHGREDIAEQFTSQKQEHVEELVHIMAKQKSESTMGSCQADIHPDPPTGYPQLSSARPQFLHDPQPAETAPPAREQVLKA